MRQVFLKLQAGQPLSTLKFTLQAQHGQPHLLLAISPDNYCPDSHRPDSHRPDSHRETFNFQLNNGNTISDTTENSPLAGNVREY